MSSLNHVILANVQPDTATSVRKQLWSLSRAMKAAGWSVVASSDATTKTISTDPEEDRWASSYGVIGPITNAGGSGAVFAAAAAGQSIVTGLSGLVSDAYATDKGRFIVANGNAYQIESVISATSCAVNAREVAVPGGTVSWEIRDASQDTYGSLATNAWILLEARASIVLVGTVPDGLLGGEAITQAATGASGQIHSVGGGRVVLHPRKRGSGAGPHGFDASEIIGSASGVAFTPSSYRGYTHQMLLRIASDVGGGISWYYAEDTIDAATSFKAKASSAGCTATTAPGGGGTGNATPTSHYATLAGAPSGSQSFFNLAPDQMKTAQIGVCDAIGEDGQSSDCSWFFMMKWHTTRKWKYVGLQALDNGPPGDECPWVGASSSFVAGSADSTIETSPHYHNYVTFLDINQASEKFGRIPNQLLAQQLPLGQQTNRSQSVLVNGAVVGTALGKRSIFVNEEGQSTVSTPYFHKGASRWSYGLGPGSGSPIVEVQTGPEPMKITESNQLLYNWDRYGLEAVGPWDGTEVTP